MAETRTRKDLHYVLFASALEFTLDAQHEMNVETLQTTSQIVIVLGILATAAGGFGSYYFGKKAEVGRSGALQTGLRALEAKFEPFAELARQARPDADQDAALAGLREDIEALRRVASKHEFAPLAPDLRAQLLEAIGRLAPEFSEAGMSVAVTHETWTRPATRRYADQLASVLREGGVEVTGPEQITYFLITPSSPVEWGYNEVDVARVEQLYATLAPLMGPTGKWTKAAHPKEGAVRIHSGGEAVFAANGVVELQ